MRNKNIKPNEILTNLIEKFKFDDIITRRVFNAMRDVAQEIHLQQTTRTKPKIPEPDGK